MASIVSIANQKGGVGKTTTTVNLAASYAQLDKRVLVIDLDFQSNATSAFGIDDQMAKKFGTIGDAIQNDWTFDRIRAKSNVENVDVVCASRDLNQWIVRLTGQPNQFKIVEALLDTDATNEYDVILIDTHPSLDCFFQSALAASHYYLVPVFLEKDSISGVGHQIQEAEKIRKHLNPMLTFLGCVITKFDKRNATHMRFESVLRQAAVDGKFRVFNTVIPVSNTVAAASASGMSLNQYKKESAVATAHISLAGEIVPLLKGKRTGRAIAPIKTDVFETVEMEIAAEL